MKHSIPGFNEDGVWIEKGPTSPRKKRGPKYKGPKTVCHTCGAAFFSRKQRVLHQQISHRKREVFTADGLPVKT